MMPQMMHLVIDGEQGAQSPYKDTFQYFKFILFKEEEERIKTP